MKRQIILALGLGLYSSAALSAGITLFDDVGPLTDPATAVPLADELVTPFVLPASFQQEVIADRRNQQSLGHQNSGLWDMIDTNRTGPDANRYLFMPFEPNYGGGVPGIDGSGVQRVDLWDPDYDTRTVTLVNPLTDTFIRGDASRWTPWGTWLTAEENTGSAGGVLHGRLFEITNPVTATGPGDTNFVHREIIPRVAHEGLAFDSANDMYFVEELNGGSIFKFSSANPNAASGADFFNAGTVYVAKVDGGGNTSATGAVVWEPLTDATGAALPAYAAAVDAGTGDLVGDAAANIAAATEYLRPEDIELGILNNGDEFLTIAMTTSDEVYGYNIATAMMTVFADRDTIDLATGMAVGAAFNAPDNMAIDADGNFYIVEDQGVPNADIWRAVDLNNDGDLLDPGEGLARWAGLRTSGAEPTGLFFALDDPNVAYVNVMHPSSGNDALVRITVTPVPGAVWLLGGGLIGLACVRRRR